MKMNFSKLSGIHISLLLFLIVTISAKDITIKGKSCASKCSKSSSIYQFTTGKRYKYDVNINQEVRDPNTGKLSKIELNCVAQFERVSGCDIQLQVENVAFKENLESKVKEYKMIKNMIEKSPYLRFGFDNGKITDVCPLNNDNPMVLNIKKAIISQLQVSMDSTDVPKYTTEIDVSGDCLTDYSIGDKSGENGIIKITKVKYIAGCSKSSKVFTAFTGLNMEKPTDGRSLPFVDATHNCKLDIKKNDVMLRSVCEETKTLQLFESAVKGTQFKIQTKIQLFGTDTKKIKSYIPTYRTSLTMDFGDRSPLGYMKSLDKKRSMNDLLKYICEQSSNDSLTTSLTESFMDLQSVVADKSAADISKAWTNLEKMKCGDLKKVKQIVLDAFSNSKSPDALRFFLSETKTDDLFGMSLGMVQNPTVELIDEFQKKIKNNKQVILLSSMIRTFCLLNPGCTKSPQIKKAIGFIMLRIGQDCGGDKAKVLYALKAVDNMGVSLNDEIMTKILNKCLMNPKAKPSVKLAAIQSMKNFGCSKHVKKFFISVLKNEERTSEERIYAYTGLMSCPDGATIKLLLTYLRQCNSHQLGSFIWSHLNNLANTKSFFKSGISEIIGEYSSDLKELERKYNLDFRHYSKNFERTISVGKSSLNLDGSFIFTPESPYPTNAILNVTIELYGRAVNLLDFNIRGNPYKLLSSQIFRSKSKKKENKFESFDKQIPKMSNEEIMLTSKIMGRQYLFYPDMTSEVMTRAVSLMRGELIKQERGLFLQDTTVSLATIGGLTLDIDMKIGVLSKIEFQVEPKSKINVRVNAAVRAVGNMQINAHCTKIGVKTESEISIDQSANGQYEMKNREYKKVDPFKETTLKYSIKPIPSSRKLFFVKNVLSSIHNFESENESAKFEVKFNRCTGDLLKYALGSKICMQYQNASTYHTFYPNIIGQVDMDKFNGLEIIYRTTKVKRKFYREFVERSKEIRITDPVEKKDLFAYQLDMVNKVFEISVLKKFIHCKITLADDKMKGEYILFKDKGTITGTFKREGFTKASAFLTFKRGQLRHTLSYKQIIDKAGPTFKLDFKRISNLPKDNYETKVVYRYFKKDHKYFESIYRYFLRVAYKDDKTNDAELIWKYDQSTPVLLLVDSKINAIWKKGTEVKQKFNLGIKYFQNNEQKLSTDTRGISYEFTITPDIDLSIGLKDSFLDKLKYDCKYTLIITKPNMIGTKMPGTLSISLKKIKKGKEYNLYSASVEYDLKDIANMGKIKTTQQYNLPKWSLEKTMGFNLNWALVTKGNLNSYDVQSSWLIDNKEIFKLSHTNKLPKMITKIIVRTRKRIYEIESDIKWLKEYNLKAKITKIDEKGKMNGKPKTWGLKTKFDRMMLQPIRIICKQTFTRNGKLIYEMNHNIAIKNKSKFNKIFIKSKLFARGQLRYKVKLDLGNGFNPEIFHSKMLTSFREIPTYLPFLDINGEVYVNFPILQIKGDSKFRLNLKPKNFVFIFKLLNYISTSIKLQDKWVVEFKTKGKSGKSERLYIKYKPTQPKTLTVNFDFPTIFYTKFSSDITANNKPKLMEIKLRHKLTIFTKKKIKFNTQTSFTKTDEYIRYDEAGDMDGSGFKLLARIPLTIEKNNFIFKMENVIKKEKVKLDLKYKIDKTNININAVTNLRNILARNNKYMASVLIKTQTNSVDGKLQLKSNRKELISMRTIYKFNRDYVPKVYKLNINFKTKKVINLNVDKIVYQPEKIKFGGELSFFYKYNKVKIDYFESLKFSKQKSNIVLRLKTSLLNSKSMVLYYNRDFSKDYKIKSSFKSSGVEIFKSSIKLTADFAKFKSAISVGKRMMKVNYKNESNALNADLLLKSEILELNIKKSEWNKQSQQYSMINEGKYKKSPFSVDLMMNFKDKFVGKLKVDWKKKNLENWKINLIKREISISSKTYHLLTDNGVLNAQIKYDIKSIKDFSIKSNLITGKLNLLTCNILYYRKESLKAMVDLKYKTNEFSTKINVNSDKTKLTCVYTLIVPSKSIAVKDVTIDLKKSGSKYSGMVKNYPNYDVSYEMSDMFKHKLTVLKKKTNYLKIDLQVYDSTTKKYFVLVQYKTKIFIDFKGQILLDYSKSDVNQLNDLFSGKIPYNMTLDGKGLIWNTNYTCYLNQFFGKSSKLKSGNKTGFKFNLSRNFGNKKTGIDSSVKVDYNFPFFIYKRKVLYTDSGKTIFKSKHSMKYQGLSNLHFETKVLTKDVLQFNFLLSRNKFITQIYGDYNKAQSIGFRYQRNNPNRNIRLHLQYEPSNNNTLSTNFLSLYPFTEMNPQFYLNFRNKFVKFDFNSKQKMKDDKYQVNVDMSVKTTSENLRLGSLKFNVNYEPMTPMKLNGDINVSVNGKKMINETCKFTYSSLSSWHMNVGKLLIITLSKPGVVYFHWNAMSYKVTTSIKYMGADGLDLNYLMPGTHYIEVIHGKRHIKAFYEKDAMKFYDVNAYFGWDMRRNNIIGYKIKSMPFTNLELFTPLVNLLFTKENDAKYNVALVRHTSSNKPDKIAINIESKGDDYILSGKSFQKNLVLKIRSKEQFDIGNMQLELVGMIKIKTKTQWKDWKNLKFDLSVQSGKERYDVKVKSLLQSKAKKYNFVFKITENGKKARGLNFKYEYMKILLLHNYEDIKILLSRTRKGSGFRSNAIFKLSNDGPNLTFKSKYTTKPMTYIAEFQGGSKFVISFKNLRKTTEFKIYNVQDGFIFNKAMKYTSITGNDNIRKVTLKYNIKSFEMNYGYLRQVFSPSRIVKVMGSIMTRIKSRVTRNRIMSVLQVKALQNFNSAYLAERVGLLMNDWDNFGKKLTNVYDVNNDIPILRSFISQLKGFTDLTEFSSFMADLDLKMELQKMMLNLPSTEKFPSMVFNGFTNLLYQTSASIHTLSLRLLRIRDMLDRIKGPEIKTSTFESIGKQMSNMGDIFKATYFYKVMSKQEMFQKMMDTYDGISKRMTDSTLFVKGLRAQLRQYMPKNTSTAEMRQTMNFILKGEFGKAFNNIFRPILMKSDFSISDSTYTSQVYISPVFTPMFKTMKYMFSWLPSVRSITEQPDKLYNLYINYFLNYEYLLFTKDYTQTIKNYFLPASRTGYVLNGQYLLTFDGKSTVIGNGKCSHLLARDFVDKQFAIVMDRQSSSEVSYKIEYFKTVTFKIGKTVEIFIENERIKFLPTRISEGKSYIEIFQTINTYEMRLNNGVSVVYIPDVDELQIKLPGSLHGQVKGMLGSNDFDPGNDRHLPSGKSTNDIGQLINSWKIGTCNSKTKTGLYMTRQNPKSIRKCIMWSHVELNFCKTKIDVQPYLDICKTALYYRDFFDTQIDQLVCQLERHFIMRCTEKKFQARIRPSCNVCPKKKNTKKSLVSEMKKPYITVLVESKPCSKNYMDIVANFIGSFYDVKNIEPYFTFITLSDSGQTRANLLSVNGKYLLEKKDTMSVLKYLRSYEGSVNYKQMTAQSSSVMEGIAKALTLPGKDGLVQSIAAFPCGKCTNNPNYKYSVLSYQTNRNVPVLYFTYHFNGGPNVVGYTSKDLYFVEGEAMVKQKFAPFGPDDSCSALASQFGGSVWNMNSVDKNKRSRSFPPKFAHTIAYLKWKPAKLYGCSCKLNSYHYSTYKCGFTSRL